MPIIDLRLDSISKAYRIRSASEPGTRSRFQKLTRSRTESKEFWAVRDVSFDVYRGESLAIIGHNGAGKSTILKLLSNITTPTAGTIFINGRMSALLEVGSGFHPDLTGRENVFLSGSILGMRRREITSNLESIVEFAGVRQFIDIPVKQYSSGMTVRLGFSIAAHLNPDILLLDEVLAVGDRSFQDKCQQRIAELHQQGTTLVFISHDLTAVRRLCQRVILLQKGEVVTDGEPEEVIRRYTETASFHQQPRVRPDFRAAEIVHVSFYRENGDRSASFRTGEPVTARLEYLAHEEIINAAVSVFFYSSDSTLIAQWTTAWSGPPLKFEEGPGFIEFSCIELGLQPGVYQVDVTIDRGQGDTREEVEWQGGCTSIHVEAGKHIRGAIYMPHRWRQHAPTSPLRIETPALRN